MLLLLTSASCEAVKCPALTVDRVALGTSWRRSLVTTLTWVMCVLPFALVTQSLQNVDPLGTSLWWQQPVIAGNSLAFYIFKTVVPNNLCGEYGRTPHWIMLHAWSYAVWTIPLGLLVFCFIHRKRRPIVWLGLLLFVTFLLPTLGLTCSGPCPGSTNPPTGNDTPASRTLAPLDQLKEQLHAAPTPHTAAAIDRCRDREAHAAQCTGRDFQVPLQSRGGLPLPTVILVGW